MSDKAPRAISLADHPRAALLVRRAKGWGALFGFGVATAASFLNGAPLSTAFLRGFAGAAVCYVVAWLGAVTIARSWLRAHAQAVAEQMVERRRRAAAAAVAARSSE